LIYGTIDFKSIDVEKGSEEEERFKDLQHFYKKYLCGKAK
jgi:hypothetical protein